MKAGSGFKGGVFLAKHLSDLQKKKIVADFVDTQNYSETARKNNTSITTVRRVVAKDQDLVEKVNLKKAQNDTDILAYMESKHDAIKRFLSYVLDKRLNPDTNGEELDRISLPQITTMYGIVVDKSVKAKELGNGDKSGVEIKVEMGPLEDYAG